MQHHMPLYDMEEVRGPDLNHSYSYLSTLLKKENDGVLGHLYLKVTGKEILIFVKS